MLHAILFENGLVKKIEPVDIVRLYRHNIGITVDLR